MSTGPTALPTGRRARGAVVAATFTLVGAVCAGSAAGALALGPRISEMLLSVFVG